MKLSLPCLSQSLFFLLLMILLLSRLRSSSETDLVESLKTLVTVASRVREEKQDNLHESSVNENVKGTLK